MNTLRDAAAVYVKQGLTSFSEADLREQLEYHKFNEEHINVAIEEIYR